MKVSLWAEIRRLVEVEGLTGRQVIRRLHCGREDRPRGARGGVAARPSPEAPRIDLDPFKPAIDAIIAKYPDFSAVRVREKIAKGEAGYHGELTVVRDYLRKIRPDSRRVYSEVFYAPGNAMQVDFGSCGKVSFGSTLRRVSVFVAVLCFSRLIYIEFTLSQPRATFIRGIAHALAFFGGSVERVIHDNLRPVVLRGSGRNAVHHSEFLAFCGLHRMEPVACEKKDPESKGIVESGVGYVKENALAGRNEELTTFAAYEALAVTWRDETANVRPTARRTSAPWTGSNRRGAPSASSPRSPSTPRRPAGHRQFPRPGALRRQPVLRAARGRAEDRHDPRRHGQGRRDLRGKGSRAPRPLLRPPAAPRAACPRSGRRSR